jgi:TetR/AcrR family transcriptional regulator, regulator of cefoperazone and chloramphenicol sensitivity
MKHKPDQAFGHREVFCFFLVITGLGRSLELAHSGEVPFLVRLHRIYSRSLLTANTVAKRSVTKRSRSKEITPVIRPDFCSGHGSAPIALFIQTTVLIGGTMIRPTEYTRHAIIKAAVDLFADKGFEGASVRDIVTKARVNQAAINYHFKGKSGLYLEVLKTASDKLTDQAGFSAEELRSLSREDALRSLISRQLRPLMFRDEMSRYIRIFAWESAHPTKVFRKFVAANATSYLTAATDIVRRFLPPDTEKRIALCVAIWLMGQCGVFARSRELFAQEPFGITMDHPFVDELTELITRLAIGGLLQASTAASHAGHRGSNKAASTQERARCSLGLAGEKLPPSRALPEINELPADVMAEIV